MSRTITRYGCAIARALGHKCAPSPEQEAQANTLEELWRTMRTNNTQRRVKRPHREVAEWNLGRRNDGTPNLTHTSHTGRLVVEATDTWVTMDFWAGEPEDRVAGLVAYFRISENADGTTKIELLNVPDVAHNKRPDRLNLLVKIDHELDGEIKRFLNTPRSGDRHLCEKILRALPELAIY
jgi:hypothetical protein